MTMTIRPVSTVEFIGLSETNTIGYYGVSFNLAHVRRFLHRATRILWKWLNRRSQRRSMTWDQFHRFLQMHPLPRAKIYHALF